MSIVQTTPLAFKLALYGRLTTDTLKMALYTGSASLGENTLAYTSAGEVAGAGYTAGGLVLTNVTVQGSESDNSVYVSFDNPTWTGVSFVARAALIYDVTMDNVAVAILDFGSDKQAGPNFTVQLPPNTAGAALLRCN